MNAEMQLTNSADKLITLMYKSYLEKSKFSSKSQATFFTFDEIQKLIPEEHQEDVIEYMSELSKIGFLNSLDIAGNASLTSKTIIYMETKIGRTIDKVIDYIAKLKP